MKKSILFLVIILTLILAACGNKGDANGSSSNNTKLKEIKFGYQKGMSLLSLLKEKSNVESRLEKLGYKVTWNEFVTTPGLLEAMVPNGVVFGGGGSPGGIFGQQAGRGFTRVAAQTGVTGGSSIIVAKDSNFKSLEDLKGKVVAVAKGTSSHYILAQALKKAGLKMEDVNLKFINPAEAFSAFGKGDIDAWAIWDPFTAEAESSLGARVIADSVSVFGDKAEIEGENMYYAESQFAKEHPEVIEVVVDELKVLGKWANEHTDESAEILAKMYNSNVDIQKIVEKRAGNREILPMDEKTIAPLEHMTKFFVEEGILKETIDVKSDKYNWKK